MNLLYIIGEPGAGKTTVVKRLTRSVPFEVRTVPYVSWTQYSTRLVQVGHDRGTFGGTDALGMASQKHVLGWLDYHLSEDSFKYVLAEGDRLANGKFFEAIHEMGIHFTVACIQAEPELLQERREKRNAEIGKAQDERWLKTRATKVRNLAERWVAPEWTLDASLPVPELARLLSRHPVGNQFVKLRKKARAK